MSDTGETGQDLVTIPEASVYAVFTDKAKIEPYLEKVRAVVAEFKGDIYTASGRKSIASMAFKVTKIKTYIEGLGKDLAAEQKEVPKKIDATRKHARETLEAIAEDVRKPLTDWENAEKVRVQKHTDALTLLDTFARGEYLQTIEAIKANIATVAAIVIGPACEEFEADYTAAHAKAETALREALAKAEKAESDRLELEALRKKQAERDESDRIAALEAAAAAKAKKDAEDAAQAEAAKVAAKAKADADAVQAELDRIAAKALVDQEAAQLAIAKAEQDARDTEARLKREADERAAQEAADLAAREADTKHKGAVNRAALAALVEGGIDAETAKKVIALIAKKMIPAIGIQY